MALTASQGQDIVSYARAVIEGHFTGKKPAPPPSLKALFADKGGVFVTLHTAGGDLRGCIGYPEPTLALGNATEHAALCAAFEDPRFPPVEAGELECLIVEVSVLSKPEQVKVPDPREYPKKILVGRDGLIAEMGWARGLLLPQVPVECGWGPEEFLMQTCHKAGLPPTAWMERGFKLYSFGAQVFKEDGPRGRVAEQRLR
jgi:uncharacterized protein